MSTTQTEIALPAAPSSGNAISILSLADEVTAEIFAFLGATNTARCAKTCRSWCRVSRHSRALWRRFTFDDFGLAGGAETADWHVVYTYIKRQQHRYFEAIDDCFIPSQLVFCDDGSHQPGNNPEHALQRNPDVCWCTNAFVDQDVDLVADLHVPHLVMALEIANGGERFSAPVKEALAFCSLDMPDLDKARAYDGAKGIALAQDLSDEHKTTMKKIPMGHPLAGFSFPGIPRAYSARIQQPALRPTVARYVHFKLLTSSKCFNRVSNNIDVCSLFAFGVPLPELGRMIRHQEATNLPPDPSRYSRRHKVREYPWHIHDAFHHHLGGGGGGGGVDQFMDRRQEQRLQRLNQMLEENRRHLQELEEMVGMQMQQQQQLPPDAYDDDNDERF